MRTCGSDTIVLATLVNRKHSFVHFYNVHSCPEIDTNLLSLSTLEAKRLQFSAMNALLEIQDSNSDTIFQTKQYDDIYLLSQPKPIAYHCQSQQKVYYLTTAKLASKEQ